MSVVDGQNSAIQQSTQTFSLPEGYFEKRISLPETWDYHNEHSPDHPLFVYDHGPDDIRTITWRQGNRAIHYMARIVQSFAKQHGQSIQDPMKPPVFGILAVIDSMIYWALLTGIIRAGYQCFVISPRNSAIAVAHLLKATGCRTVFMSGDSAMQTLSREAFASLDSTVAVASIPGFNELYNEDHNDFQTLPPFELQSLDVPAFICHSSGSTNFPKPITFKHKNLIISSLFPYSSNEKLTGKISGLHSLPLYHIMGAIYSIFWPTSTGIIASMFRPVDPPVKSTPESTLKAALVTQCDFLVTVPLFVEAWSRSPESLSTLKSSPDLKILWGGGPLSQEAGDIVTRNGININIIYGATEAGVFHKLNTTFLGEDWPYFERSETQDIYMQPHEDGDGLFKLIVLSSPKYVPNVINWEVDGQLGYDTNDLVIAHPTKKDWWRLYGRADDQIMHSTGEKTNPGPLESIISKDPAIQSCLMFGRGEFQTGIIVEPVEEKSFDPGDVEKLAEFRNAIWPSIEEANQYAPQHSRIFKEMIIITNPEKPLLTTDKCTIKRQPNINLYVEEIRAAYAALETSSRQDVPFPTSWDVDNVMIFVRSLIKTVVGESIGDLDDIFQRGADSLQATSIRNSISRALRNSNKDTSKLGQNSVYSYPTIASLASFVYKISSGMMENGISDVTVEMKAMVEEFTQDFSSHTPSKPAPSSEVILVTGTTGSLGAPLLEKLIAMSSISRVYALNRPDKLGKSTVYERQKKAFEEQDIDISVLDSAKLVLLEGDTTSPDLGLPKATLDEIIGLVTSIIHNAWRVDFNLSLSSFKPLVAGVQNLINISLASPFPKPPYMVFISSIGSLSGWSERRAVPEQVLDDPCNAVGSGYGESKWVSERILHIANQQTPSRNVVVRLGQVCGSTKIGKWNTWEWFPAIVQSYKIVACLPESQGLVSWVPVDAVAAAIVDMRISDWPFLHLVHPKPVSWMSVMTPIAAILDVPMVSYSQWLSHLQKTLEESTNTSSAVQAATENPALRLVDFYVNALRRNPQGSDSMKEEAFIGTSLETKETVKVSKTMADLPPLCEADVRRWVAYWKKEGVLS